MKTLGVLAFVVSTLAGAQNPEYPQTAHVKSAVFTHTTAANEFKTEIEIGSLVYVANSICKKAEVGHNYPAKLDGKHLTLLVGDKTCKYRINGTQEK